MRHLGDSNIRSFYFSWEQRLGTARGKKEGPSAYSCGSWIAQAGQKEGVGKKHPPFSPPVLSSPAGVSYPPNLREIERAVDSGKCSFQDLGSKQKRVEISGDRKGRVTAVHYKRPPHSRHCRDCVNSSKVVPT